MVPISELDAWKLDASSDRWDSARAEMLALWLPFCEAVWLPLPLLPTPGLLARMDAVLYTELFAGLARYGWCCWPWPWPCCCWLE